MLVVYPTWQKYSNISIAQQCSELSHSQNQPIAVSRFWLLKFIYLTYYWKVCENQTKSEFKTSEIKIYLKALVLWVICINAREGGGGKAQDQRSGCILSTNFRHYWTKQKHHELSGIRLVDKVKTCFCNSDIDCSCYSLLATCGIKQKLSLKVF